MNSQYPQTLWGHTVASLKALLGVPETRPRFAPSPSNRMLRWANVKIPYQDASNHFIAIGTTGSGKTTIARLLMQSAFKGFGSEQCRALVYDAKQDMLPILSALLPEASIATLNPFDDRGVSWDLCKDLNEPIRLLDFISTIFPEQSDANPFFRLATVHCALT